MNHPILSSSPSRSLAGARIWLSGAIPEDFTEAQRNAMLDFVGRFARYVFEGGGHLVHGSHPSLAATLLAEARRYKEQTGHQDRLILAISRYWSKKPEYAPPEAWRALAVIHETPEASGERAEENSLELLRQWMASRCDAIVVVGGKERPAAGGEAGVPWELNLAIQRGLPSFLLGGFGGAAHQYLGQDPDILSRLKNGLDPATNQNLSREDDPEHLAASICTHLERMPLVRGRGSNGVSFRILALDGGGVKGAFTASALATWEDLTGLRVVDHFDLVAGTSTGGILALGLGLGLSGREMLAFYQDRGPEIFPVTRLRGRVRHIIKHVVKPKYSQEVLLRELEEALYAGGPPQYLKDSRCRLVIPTYHAVAGASYVFRTPHHPHLIADAHIEAAHAALATAAAPTFFTAAKIGNMITQSSYFDGGVWANSPVMAAIIEAVSFLQIPLERIDVLSVGTTGEPFTVRRQTRAGILGWLWKKKILDLLMNVQQESALKLAQHLVGEPRFLRVNVMTVPGTYQLDGSGDIEELADRGNHTAKEPDTLREVKSRFLNGIHVTRWQPYP